jgi:predicted ATPase/DNA-binding CsgD family transcriptional regulator
VRGWPLDNLPVELSSFVGREVELEELEKMLTCTRLLTLTGIGGAGKTRLAIKLGRSLADQYPDGIWLVALGAVLDENLLPQALASVIDVRERSGEALEDSLVRHLSERHALLILDGCEHLVDRCARLVDLLLGSVSQLRILATSQEALRVPGEVIWRVPSLSLPPNKGDGSLTALLQSEAIQLFVERARQVNPGFTLSDRNAAALARICRRLDGLPLAIELAAAELRLMPPGELELRLEDRFRLLTGGSRTAMARQQTLRATVDWSYRRLDEAQQALFRRLAVFAGSFTLQAVEAVCQGPPVPADVLGCLTGLVDRSLVSVHDQPGAIARYQLLETLRQYGQEKLADSFDNDLPGLHARYYGSLAEKASERLIGAAQSASLAGLEIDQANLRAALSWGLANDRELALKLAAALGPHWYVRGSLTEGHEWLAAATGANPNPSPTLARALAHAGWVAYWRGDYQQCRAFAERALSMARELRDAVETARAVNLMGWVYHVVDEDFQAARQCCSEAFAIRSRLGDRWGMASSLNNLALATYDAGDLEVAEAMMREACSLTDALGDGHMRANALDSLGRIVMERGKYQEADRYHRECLALAGELGDKVGVADGLDGLTQVAAALGDPRRTLTLAGAADTLHDRIGYQPPAPWRRRVQRSIDGARALLPAEDALEAWDRGSKFTEEEAVSFALAPGASSEVSAHKNGSLTRREQQIAAMVAKGLRNRQIAAQLKISQRTVDAHVDHIRTKLDVHSRVQIAAWVSENEATPLGSSVS